MDTTGSRSRSGSVDSAGLRKSTSRRPGAKVAGTIAAAVGAQGTPAVVDERQGPTSVGEDGGDIEKIQQGEQLQEVNEVTEVEQDVLPAGVEERRELAATVVSQAEAAQEGTEGHHSDEHASTTRDDDGDAAEGGCCDSHAALSPSTTAGAAPVAAVQSDHDDVDGDGEVDYRLSQLELRLIGEVMLRDLNPHATDPHTQSFDTDKWQQHFQANVISYTEFVQSFSDLRLMPGPDHADWRCYFSSIENGTEEDEGVGGGGGGKRRVKPITWSGDGAKRVGKCRGWRTA